MEVQVVVQVDGVFGEGMVWGQVVEVLPNGYRIQARNDGMVFLKSGSQTITNGLVQVGEHIFSSVRGNGVAANITRFFYVPLGELPLKGREQE